MLRNSILSIKDGSTVPYGRLLNDAQTWTTINYSEMLAETESIDRAWMQKQVFQYLESLQIADNGPHSLEEIAQAIVADMIGYSFIDKYLSIPGFQELNIDAWNYATVTINEETSVIDDTFVSPIQAVDIINKMVLKGSKPLDQSSPTKISNISDDTRIAAAIYPVARKKAYVTASIRRVDSAVVKSNKLDMEKEASPDMLELLRFAAANGISMCMSGHTGCGKSTLESYILNYLSMQEKKRVLTIEEGSSQLDITEYDETGRPLNDVVSFQTRRSENKEQDISQIALMAQVVKYHPDVVCVDEMVDSEAYVTIETARGGHLTFSSIHSQSADRTYSKITTLAQHAKEASGYSYETIMRLSVEAFPLIVHMQRCKDKIRRVMEILEGESYDPIHGLVCRTLFQFNTTDTICHNDGTFEVKGQFEKVRGISGNLQKLLLSCGAPKEDVMRYAREAAS